MFDFPFDLIFTLKFRLIGYDASLNPYGAELRLNVELVSDGLLPVHLIAPPS